jgi:hypothetical protein
MFMKNSDSVSGMLPSSDSTGSSSPELPWYNMSWTVWLSMLQKSWVSKHGDTYSIWDDTWAASGIVHEPSYSVLSPSANVHLLSWSLLYQLLKSFDM